MEAARSLFVEDLALKSAELAAAAEQWLSGELPADEFVERAYRLTHALKGIALTVGFEDVHAVAEAVSVYKHRHEADPLPREELVRLAAKTLELKIYRRG